MLVQKVIDFDMDQNCYIVLSENNNECILIDPGCAHEKILNTINENNLNVSAILLTHCHYDHVFGVKKIKEKTGAKVISGRKCSENIKNPILNVSKMFGDELTGDESDKVLDDGEVFKVSDLEIKCIETPGHTDCSVCYIVKDSIFTGDTLFLRTTGRWDLPTGNFDMLEKSLKEKLYKLDDGMKVYPGHGNSTTIGYEKKFNMSINNI